MSAISTVLQYGPDQLTDGNGRPLGNAIVTVKTSLGALASLYQPGAQTEAGFGRVAAPNPLVADSQGVFTFFADAGTYTISSPGVTTYVVTLPTLGAGSELGISEVATQQAWNGGANTDVTGLAVTVTVPAGAGVFAEAEIPWVQPTAGTSAFLVFALLEDGVTVQQCVIWGTVGQYGPPIRLARSRTPSPGTHTYKVQAAFSNGPTNVNLNNTGYNSFIRVTAR